MKRFVYVSRLRELLAAKNAFMRDADPRFEDYRHEDLADFVGVSRQAIQAWMSDAGVKRLPITTHQRKLEEFFGVPWTSMWYIGLALDVEAEQHAQQ